MFMIAEKKKEKSTQRGKNDADCRVALQLVFFSPSTRQQNPCFTLQVIGKESKSRHISPASEGRY